MENKEQLIRLRVYGKSATRAQTDGDVNSAVVNNTTINSATSKSATLNSEILK